MTGAQSSTVGMRQVYMILSRHSLHYAAGNVASLFRHTMEPINLRLITDSREDQEVITQAVAALQPDARHAWSVIAEDDLADAETATFAGYPHLRQFRRGHPCWRKVTDPLLMASTGEEMIVMDPDVYFPNRFCFEQTLPQGLQVMWQRPNCLLPPEIVRRAMDAEIRLARHVDLGVVHWRGGADLEWLDWLIGKLGGGGLPRLMHVEAIVWAAIAMRVGGGYLDPALWVCWHRTQAKRVRRLLGATGEDILAGEPWRKMKAFHAGGEAKWLLPAVISAETNKEAAEVAAAGRVYPLVELTRRRYELEQSAKGLLRGAGYYRIFGPREA